MITLDTSGLIAYVNAGDRLHQQCREAIDHDPGPYIVPAGVLAEIAWILETRFPEEVERAFLDDLQLGLFRVDWNEADLVRVRELLLRYNDLRIGLGDAFVIACAERLGGRVLTTDWRHFQIVARGEKTITILPSPDI